jgi:hypothetical protein
MTTRRSASFQSLTTRLSSASLNSRTPARRGSQAPITPPHSPGRSDGSIDLDMDLEDLEDPDIVVDGEPRYSGPEAQAAGEAMIIERLNYNPEGLTGQEVIQRPLRLLEEEPSHLQGAGLTLTDFQVRGILGRLLSSSSSTFR